MICLKNKNKEKFKFYRIKVRFDSTSDLRIRQQPRITREKSRKLKISV